jgi:hypothetical protein
LRRQLQVGHREVLLELGGARDGLAPRGDDDAMAVEDQLVLSAHQVAHREGGAGLPRALLDHLLPREALAAVIGGGRGVHDQAGAREGLHRGGRARVPDVLADREPHADPGHLDQRRAVARLEVAALVEDAVIGQEHLAVGRPHGAVGDDRGGVVGG